MITCNLNVLLAERNMKISELAKMTGISRTTLTALAYNKSKGIQFDTLDTICSFLKIQSNDLFKQERFDYDFSIEGTSQLEFLDDTSDFPFDKNGTIFSTKYRITYKDRVIEEVIKLNVHLPLAFDKKDDKEKILIQANTSMDFVFSDTKRLLDSIPIIFQTAFYDELKETIRSHFLIMDQNVTHMSDKQIENCIINID